ncbi:sulfotransferase family protein [Nocardioides sp.]|uniref:sulfotransferase family protein n=1 Tax=Nocardioides sp. TaxID=35761 RepID=UPI002722E3D9|nr:sulfotransferase family protein [Nocardioides sp.]MDO9457475.1 sulfotransferase family protein [Nocardioides sp.]
MTDPRSYPRTVLFVAGAGRSGTSTMAGLAKILGLHVPQPEVAADATNPKGFGEPQWVVDHHDRLLREAVVQVSDSRPQAWFDTGRVSTREPERIATAEWLESHFTADGGHPELVVKDPRLSWFLGLWRVAAIRTGARPVFVTMLRPPAEVVGSKQTYYANKLGSAHLAASWLNMLLHTERGTRDSGAAADGGGRVFVRYADLLDDWTRVTMDVGERLQLQHVLHANSEQIRDGHRFVDPSLRRMTLTLDDLALPPRLHELVGETWAELNRLAEPGGDDEGAHTALDQLREAYSDLSAAAAAISRSSVVHTEHLLRGRGRPAPAPEPPAEPRGADRLPHGLRAAVPPSVRRGLRKVAGRERPA